MAVMALEREATVAQFTPEKMRDAVIADFIRRVKVVHEPKYDAAGGKLRVACRAVVTTRDGRMYEAEVLYRKGSAEDPMSEAELRAKFEDLAGKALRAESVKRIAAVVDRVETLDDVAPLFAELAAASGG